MKKVVIALVAALVVAHQDWWWWDDINPKAFGFLPIGLTYHAVLSVAASLVWALAVTFCWPADVDVAEAEWLDENAKTHREL